MVIPYVVGVALVVLVVRWLAVWSKNRAYNADMERRIRNRSDLHRL
jgi:hypothetical protein